MLTESLMHETRESVFDEARSGTAERFVRLYGGFSFRIARRVGLQPADAEDIAQTTVHELLQKLPNFQYDPRRGKFRSLVKSIALNRIRDLWRKRGALPLGELSDEPAVLGGDVSDADLDEAWRTAKVAEALELARRRVKHSTYQSFHLTVIDEQTPAQAAAELGLTPNQVSQNKRRVLELVAAYLKEFEHELA